EPARARGGGDRPAGGRARAGRRVRAGAGRTPGPAAASGRRPPSRGRGAVGTPAGRRAGPTPGGGRPRRRAAARPVARAGGGLPDEDRHQQFRIAVASFLAALASTDAGSVLHLDDVHWIDDATLRVLAHLVERLPDLPLVILATGRDGPESAAVMGRLRTTV